MNIQAIVTDIEGTTSSIDFVHQVLFPYSVQKIPQYLRDRANDPAIHKIIHIIQQEINQADASLDTIIVTLMTWIQEDHKHTALKALQGMVWEYGFKNHEFTGHIYEDARHNLERWYQQGIKLYVFSSGSVKAQQLLFGHTAYGDLTYLFRDYFDTNIGNKQETIAYQNIAQAIAINPAQILFLSDVVAELDAAKLAGYQTRLLVRGATPPYSDRHIMVDNFQNIIIN